MPIGSPGSAFCPSLHDASAPQNDYSRYVAAPGANGRGDRHADRTWVGTGLAAVGHQAVVAPRVAFCFLCCIVPDPARRPSGLQGPVGFSCRTGGPRSKSYCSSRGLPVRGRPGGHARRRCTLQQKAPATKNGGVSWGSRLPHQTDPPGLVASQL